MAALRLTMPPDELRKHDESAETRANKFAHGTHQGMTDRAMDSSV